MAAGGLAGSPHVPSAGLGATAPAPPRRSADAGSLPLRPLRPPRRRGGGPLRHPPPALLLEPSPPRPADLRRRELDLHRTGRGLFAARSGAGELRDLQPLLRRGPRLDPRRGAHQTTLTAADAAPGPALLCPAPAFATVGPSVRRAGPFGKTGGMSRSASAKNGAELLVRSLEARGVAYIFGVPGGAILPILDVLADGGPRFVLCRHETGAAFMAQAWGQITGTPGVVLTTSGPGLINAVCGVATATEDRDPLVVITGQIPRSLRFKQSHMNL